MAEQKMLRQLLTMADLYAHAEAIIELLHEQYGGYDADALEEVLVDDSFVQRLQAKGYDLLDENAPPVERPGRRPLGRPGQPPSNRTGNGNGQRPPQGRPPQNSTGRSQPSNPQRGANPLPPRAGGDGQNGNPGRNGGGLRPNRNGFSDRGLNRPPNTPRPGLPFRRPADENGDDGPRFTGPRPASADAPLTEVLPQPGMAVPVPGLSAAELPELPDLPDETPMSSKAPIERPMDAAPRPPMLPDETPPSTVPVERPMNVAPRPPTPSFPVSAAPAGLEQLRATPPLPVTLPVATAPPAPVEPPAVNMPQAETTPLVAADSPAAPAKRARKQRLIVTTVVPPPPDPPKTARTRRKSTPTQQQPLGLKPRADTGKADKS